MKKLVCILLSVVMLFGILPFEALAFDNTGWLWPVPSSKNMGYGFFSGHAGIDIWPQNKAYYDTEIYASKSGTIAMICYGCRNFSNYGNGITCVSLGICSPNNGYHDGYCNNGLGNGFVINHGNGVFSEYGHMSSVDSSLTVGTYVYKGQMLGYMGSYGMSTGPHLHFGIRENVWDGFYWNGTKVNNNPYGSEYKYHYGWNGVQNIYYDTTGHGAPPAGISWESQTGDSEWNIGYTNATFVVKGILTDLSSSDITEISYGLYDAVGNLLASGIEDIEGRFDGSSNEFILRCDMNRDLGITLETGTPYNFWIYVTLGGQKYYGHIEFGTYGANLSWEQDIYDGHWNIGETNATVGGKVTINKGAVISEATEVGVTLYDSEGNIIGSKSEWPNYNVNYNFIRMWYDINSELGVVLEPQTDYKCRFYIVLSGVKYESPFYAFTTGGQKETYTVVYDANGGEGAPDNQIKTKGESIVLSETVPYREGYTFEGWAESPDASEAQYKPGDIFSKDGNITLYAVWKIIFIYGDVNGDEKINVLDANLVRRYSARLNDLSEAQLSAADVDGNGKVNILDANLIRRHSAKIIDKFPVEE